MTTQSLTKEQATSYTRQIFIGASLLMTALLMFILFLQNTKPGQTATFGTNLSGPDQPVKIPDIVLPVQPTLYVLIGITILLAAWVLIRGTRAMGWLIEYRGFLFCSIFFGLGHPG